MRVFTVDAKYAAALEGAITKALDEIGIDEFARQNGWPPRIPDFAIDEKRTGQVFVAVGDATELPATIVVESGKPMRARRRKTA